jgi:hypothetical protein
MATMATRRWPSGLNAIHPMRPRFGWAVAHQLSNRIIRGILAATNAMQLETLEARGRQRPDHFLGSTFLPAINASVSR